ncbi:MAG: hypothetical protein ACK4NF_07510, partial [Planctomycetota bacterium]
DVILYSILFSNLMNLYIQSFSTVPLKNPEGVVEKTFKGSIDKLSIAFAKNRKFLYNIWRRRKINFFKIETCSIENRYETFLMKWGSLSISKKYMLLMDLFAKKYLEIAGRTVIRKYSNIQCYINIVK